MIVLKINNLSKSYGNKPALSQMKLEITNGNIFGLVGPNGAGKTTLIRCITNLLEYDSGEIEIFGKQFKNSEIEIKQNIGVLYDFLGLYDYLKGQEYLEFIGKIYGLKYDVIESRIAELLPFFNLEGDQWLLIDGYSKGMKKKLALASIILHNPEFIILDEPFEGMDPIAIKKTKQLFRDLKKQGKTILITSHILTYLENLCDEVAIINKGKLVYQNTMENVKSDFKNKVNKNESLSALEEIFLDVVGEDEDSKKTLSWIGNKNEES